MNVWLWAATGMIAPLAMAGGVCCRGGMGDRVVGLELVGTLVTLELILLAEGFHRGVYMDLPLTLAFLTFGGGMVFARFVQRWL